MAELTTKRRNVLPKSSFGVPGQHKYPMNDKAHAANANARATQQLNKGNLSTDQHARIVAKANHILNGNTH